MISFDIFLKIVFYFHTLTNLNDYRSLFQGPNTFPIDKKSPSAKTLLPGEKLIQFHIIKF